MLFLIMTEQEVLQNPEYKMSTNSLKRQYHWIKGFEFDGDINEYRTIIFITLIVDWEEIASTYHWTLQRFVKPEQGYITPYMGTAFKEGTEYTSPILDKLNREFELFHESNILPHDMKLPKELSIIAFKSNPKQ